MLSVTPQQMFPQTNASLLSMGKDVIIQYEQIAENDWSSETYDGLPTP